MGTKRYPRPRFGAGFHQAAYTPAFTTFFLSNLPLTDFGPCTILSVQKEGAGFVYSDCLLLREMHHLVLHCIGC
jgi:hypothetical protein